MAFGFLNLAMLIGLAAVALPVIAHLLSKRRFDVVQWGAMQFLELGRRTRRRIRLQDWLLLLLRMLLIALVALALARPWAQGGLLGRLSNATSRDVVFVLDSSYSTGWEGKEITPHAAAIDWIHEALEDLQPGDTVALIDARTRNRRLVVPPVTDFKKVRDVLNQLPEPSGTSDLASAITEGMQILSAGTNLSRELIVLSDNQALPWHMEDQVAWERIADLRTQPAIPPLVYRVNVGSELRDLTNYSVDRIELSRALTVPDFPIRLRTTVRQSGGERSQRQVHLEVNGQRIESQASEVALLPNGEALVEFEHRFEAVGTYVVSVVLDEDNLPADNRSEAVVIVAEGIPVLLVEGDQQLDPVRRDTFFLKSALNSTGESPWVKAEVITPNQLAEKTLGQYRVIFLCNISQIGPAEATLLTAYAQSGGTVVVAPGDLTNPQAWNSLQQAPNVPLLPMAFDKTSHEIDVDGKLVTIDHQTLELPWLERFRKEKGVDFAEARYSHWWSLIPHPPAVAANPAPAEPPVDPNAPPAPAPAVPPNPPVVLAKLSQGEPFLVSQTCGAGRILQFAVPLDADWGTLPARNDFVPFVHEFIFAHATTGPSRNVHVGDSLVLNLPANSQPEDWVATGPGVAAAKVVGFDVGGVPSVSLPDVSLPGRYYLHAAGTVPNTGEPFVVDFERTESDLKPLDEATLGELLDVHEIRPVASMASLTADLKQQNSRTDLWWLLLFGVLALLVGEVALTRQMVKGGHAALETA